MNCLSQTRKFKNKEPVWNDASDEPREHQENLKRSRHEESSSSESDEDDDCDMYAGDVRSKKISIGQKELKFTHQVNINSENIAKSQIKGIQFHPKSKVALVTVQSGQADLFEIDGERNRYIQNIKLPKTKTPFCRFTNDGDSVVISSRQYRGSFYIYDMMSSKIKDYTLKVGKTIRSITDFTLSDSHMACREEGRSEVLILNGKSFEIESSFKINQPVSVVKFMNDHEIVVAGQNSDAYIWDLRKTSVCKNRFTDQGCVHITSMDLSERSNQLAIGSDTGIVNIYEMDACISKRNPTPIKTLANLKSAIDLLKYNPTGELLVMSTSSQKNGFRMVNCIYGCVYKNFPIPHKQYGHLNAVDFSPRSGYLGLGCSTGRTHLIRIPYYRGY